MKSREQVLPCIYVFLMTFGAGSLCLIYQMELYNHYVLHELKPWKKNPKIKLMSHVFRVIYDVMTVIRVVTVGRYLMGTTSEFVASIFFMTKRRFFGPLLVFFC